MKLDFSTQIKLAGLPMPQAEFRFHPTRRWLADWAWPEHKLIVEIEGGIFGNQKNGQKNGWHQSISGMLDDMAKYNQMTMLGYWLLRFVPSGIENGKALYLVEEWFRSKGIVGEVHNP